MEILTRRVCTDCKGTRKINNPYFRLDSTNERKVIPCSCKDGYVEMWIDISELLQVLREEQQWTKS